MVTIDIPNSIEPQFLGDKVFVLTEVGTSLRFYSVSVERLKGCPMDGGVPSLKHERETRDGPEGWHMACACGVRGKTFSLHYDGKDPAACAGKAIYQWNTRHKGEN